MSWSLRTDYSKREVPQKSAALFSFQTINPAIQGLCFLRIMGENSVSIIDDNITQVVSLMDDPRQSE